MLDIELLKNSKHVIRGSGTLKIMQNNNMPILDLLVRESIQNSCDAAINGVEKVTIDYVHDTFDNSKLCDELCAISPRLHEMFDEKTTEFISIMDTNTTGLTGDIAGKKDPKKNNNENLNKLVYNIMDEQQNEGAGGSWGIGKTLYYRVGAGLVIYYSRVLHEGRYQDRLVAAIEENENLNTGLLRNIDDNVGVAWFGKKRSDNEIEAVIDTTYISKFLSIFKLSPLKEKETGTYVIIPYVDQKKLLENNRPQDFSRAWWDSTIEDYLYVSILRWYFPRMCNSYQLGAKLNVFINNKIVECDEDTPIFGKFMELYESRNDLLNMSNSWKRSETITFHKHDLNSDVIGTFVYGVITKDELGIKEKHLKTPNRFMLIDENEDVKKPLICFCRNSGMIINYSSDDNVCKDFICPKDSYVIGIFVVNSSNYIISDNGKKLKLDEYLRKSEKSDHTSWTDHAYNESGSQLNIVKTINKRISSILSKEFGEKRETNEDISFETRLARKFGSLFLPDYGYGNDSSKYSSNGSNGGVTRINNNRIKFIDNCISDGTMKVQYEIDIKDKISTIEFNNRINTAGKKYDAEDWEEEGLVYPCNIKAIAVQCLSKDGRKIDSENILVDNFDNYEFEDYIINAYRTNSNRIYKIVFTKRNVLKKNSFRICLDIESSDRLIQTCCDIAIKGE